MTAATTIVEYIGLGLLAARPATPNVSAGCTAWYYATDNTTLYVWNGSSWVVVGTGATGISGLSDVTIASIANRDRLVYSSGTSKWKNERELYRLGFSNPSTTVLTSSQVLGHHKFLVGVTFAANFGTVLGNVSAGGGTANATGSTVITLEKAAAASPNSFSSIGTATVGAGGVAVTLATSGGTTQAFAAGDVLRAVGPASADATFAGFYLSLAGTET